MLKFMETLFVKLLSRTPVLLGDTRSCEFTFALPTDLSQTQKAHGIYLPLCMNQMNLITLQNVPK